MNRKPKYKAEGQDYSKERGFFNAEIDVSMPDIPSPPPNPDKNWVAGAGEPVTTAAFNKMVSDYTSQKSPNDTEFVTFSREALLSVLSQFGCAGIKFVFAQRPNTTTNQLTLVMVGVDDKNNPLTSSAGDQNLLGSQDPYYSNKGNGWPPTA